MHFLWWWQVDLTHVTTANPIPTPLTWTKLFSDHRAKIDWLANQWSLAEMFSNNLSSGFGITFLISISLMAAAFFSAFSALWWDRDDAGKVAMLSPLSTSTVATLTSLSTPIGSLKFQLKCSNRFLGIFTNFYHHAQHKFRSLLFDSQQSSRRSHNKSPATKFVVEVFTLAKEGEFVSLDLFCKQFTPSRNWMCERIQQMQ